MKPDPHGQQPGVCWCVCVCHGQHVSVPPEQRHPLPSGVVGVFVAAAPVQGFLLLHSLGGGTGSGLGTYLLGLMEVRS